MENKHFPLLKDVYSLEEYDSKSNVEMIRIPNLVADDHLQEKYIGT